MAATVLVFKQVSVKFSLTSGGLTSAPDATCQVQTVELNSVPKTSTVAATMCSGETQVAGLSGWELHIIWLQDWDLTPGPGLSEFAYANDGAQVYFQVDPTDPNIKGMTGQCTITAGKYGGDAGVALTAEGTWPCLAKPTRTATLMATEAEPVPA